MDSLSIESKFICGLIERAIKKYIRKKIGANVDISFDSISVSFDGESAAVKTTVQAKIKKEDISTLLKDL